MKRSIISVAVLSAVFMSAGAFAAGEEGTLTIEGTIINSSCHFEDNKNSSTIILPEIDASRFSGLSAGDVVGTEVADPMPMKIICPAGTKLNTIRISNGEFTTDGVLKNTKEVNGDIDASKGVGVKLKLDSKLITNDQETNIKDILTADKDDPSGVEYSLKFSAQYARLNEATPVVAGEISSVLTISVSAE
ncbi:fimbrial protein [Citrobacter portucalensis]|uniref:fimbrial protein n=1 Tax=Citrobacter TaxID=544 RepID=UPI0004493C1C|nr:MULTISPECIES: fimbrial protein [Citrobacter]QMF92140.1 fimbrial protein [Citrobacter freundii]ETX63683.1 hypothetical protein P835_02806 [Citrobacter portucalensis]MCO4136809.1 fimbrial protein [Citrobacter portucalensis]MCO4153566.1 fimbrial protein [Citrobacter portucalensis]MDE9703618.1 fimbrial protein [Citrobacter portucalensis]